MLFDFSSRLMNSKEDSSLPIIAEIKQKSASNDDLLRGRNYVNIAQTYQRYNVSCISVVTGKWFGGNNKMLENIAKHVTLPILRKDFIVSKSEIEKSKELGASAVLLTKKLLSNKHLLELIEYALKLKLTPFVEVDSKNDIKEVSLLKGTVLAINNKDILYKEQSGCGYKRSLKLSRDVKSLQVDTLVSASSIKNISQAKLLIEAGFHGLLIGTSLLNAENLEDELQQYIQAFSNKDAA
jgi:indole-3-glycerol phosphate synthase